MGKMSDNKKAKMLGFVPNPHHKQVTVKYKNSMIEVDERMGPLLKEIWKAGIDTAFSCQGGTSEHTHIHPAIREDVLWAQIVFYSNEDWLKFFKILTEDEFFVTDVLVGMSTFRFKVDFCCFNGDQIRPSVQFQPVLIDQFTGIFIRKNEKDE